MMALDQPFEGDPTSLFKRFQEFVQFERSRRRRVILIIDEAQNLGLEALEELRMLSNINADKDQPLQLMLVGQPQLRDLLRSPHLLQFAQRISSDFHLTPLAHDEVIQYIDFRLQAVGAQYHLFTPEACSVIADASQGIPRLINILCDTALVYGFAAQSDYITADLVHSVIEHKTKFGSVQLADQRR
jgi:type II secretory pathway predicted ATPase ExeA